MASTPVLVAPPGFASTVYPTVPLPVPGVPKEIVIHETPLVAVLAQVDVLAVIVIRPFPPTALNVALAGTTEKEHCAAIGVANARLEQTKNSRRSLTPDVGMVL